MSNGKEDTMEGEGRYVRRCDGNEKKDGRELYSTVCYTDFKSKVLAIQNGQRGMILLGIGNQIPQKLKSPTWLLTT